MKAFIFKINIVNMNKILNRKSVYIKELNNIKFDHLALRWTEFHFKKKEAEPQKGVWEVENHLFFRVQPRRKYILKKTPQSFFIK